MAGAQALRRRQALVAYWDGRPTDAARLAGDAGRYVPEHGARGVRAHSIHARAPAQLGDRDSALAELRAAADTAAKNVTDGPLFTGMLDFPRANQLFLAAVDYLPSVAARAWRWAPEMHEIADTLDHAGLPSEQATAAAGVLCLWNRDKNDRGLTVQDTLSHLRQEGGGDSCVSG